MPKRQNHVKPIGIGKYRSVDYKMAGIIQWLMVLGIFAFAVCLFVNRIVSYLVNDLGRALLVFWRQLKRMVKCI